MTYTPHKEITVQCGGAGEVALWGGYRISTPTAPDEGVPTVIVNEPFSPAPGAPPTGWRVEAVRSFAEPWQITALVVCGDG